MTSCSDNHPECPYRVVISEYLIDEVRFAESATAAAAAVAEDRELDALIDPIFAVVAEVPGGQRERIKIRAYPVLMYEAETEVAKPCGLCGGEPCVDDSHGRRDSVENDPLAAPMRPPPDGEP